MSRCVACPPHPNESVNMLTVLPLQDYQKDAILRQMKEYKRQKKDADDQLHELQKKAAYHHEHIRVCDAWLAQLVDEIRVLASEKLPTPPPSATVPAGMIAPRPASAYIT